MQNLCILSNISTEPMYCLQNVPKQMGNTVIANKLFNLNRAEAAIRSTTARGSFFFLFKYLPTSLSKSDMIKLYYILTNLNKKPKKFNSVINDLCYLSQVNLQKFMTGSNSFFTSQNKKLFCDAFLKTSMTAIILIS